MRWKLDDKMAEMVGKGCFGKIHEMSSGRFTKGER
jgi:hypothetical protein